MLCFIILGQPVLHQQLIYSPLFAGEEHLQRRKKAKTEAAKKKILEKEWNDLSETDEWMDAYFDAEGFKSKDKLFLPQS